MKNIYLKILIVGAVLSMACTTKVSEWVLLNSVPEKYLLVYFHKNELSGIEKEQNAEIKNQYKTANLLFKTMQRDELEKPYYALYFNNHLIFEFADKKALAHRANSPLRKIIASDLTNGKLCVMLYLKSGNSEKDEKGLTVLNNTIKTSPFGNIIRVVELDRKNMEESLLVSMLLSVENDLNEIQEPMLFGIFGRLRALEPLLANGISRENINLMIDFFTADCSCLIKDHLSGRSLLYTGSWENPQPALVNSILDANPELMHQ